MANYPCHSHGELPMPSRAGPALARSCRVPQMKETARPGKKETGSTSSSSKLKKKGGSLLLKKKKEAGSHRFWSGQQLVAAGHWLETRPALALAHASLPSSRGWPNGVSEAEALVGGIDGAYLKPTPMVGQQTPAYSATDHRPTD